MKNFTDAQLDKLADVFISMGTVIFALTVIPFFLKTEKIEVLVFFAGSLLTFLCWFFSWFFSIMVVKEIKR